MVSSHDAMRVSSCHRSAGSGHRDWPRQYNPRPVV